MNDDNLKENAILRIMLRCLLFVLMFGAALFGCADHLGAAPRPAQMTPAGVASWAQPLTASGTALPSTASYTVGDLFIVYDTASFTTFRLGSGSVWLPLVASGSAGTGGEGSGIATHSELAGLGFDESGHTGFASESAVTELDAALATVAADLQAHEDDEVDPHGNAPHYTSSVTIGSGTATGTIANIGTSTVQIEKYLRLPPTTATPSGALDGTIWYDQNTQKFRALVDGAWIDLH